MQELSLSGNKEKQVFYLKYINFHLESINTQANNIYVVNGIWKIELVQGVGQCFGWVVIL